MKRRRGVLSAISLAAAAVFAFAGYDLSRSTAAFPLEIQAAGRSEYEYETQEMYARRGENQIYGVLYIPQNAGETMPAII